MKTNSGLPVIEQPSGKPLKRRILGWPNTHLGWWPAGLAATFLTLFIINVAMLMTPTYEDFWRQTLLPFYVIFMLSCGLAAGIVGVIAVSSQHELSWLVWLAILIGLFVIVLVAGELIQLEQFLNAASIR